MRIRMPEHKYRVVVSGVKEYDGDDLEKAKKVFAGLISTRMNLQDGTHTITGEPLIEAISPGGRGLVVFYGASLADVVVLK